MSYHYLFLDDAGDAMAYVRYEISPTDGSLVVEKTIPESFPLRPQHTLTLRHVAAMFDLDEAESRDQDREEN